MPTPIPIKIENAKITGTGGSITNATITGDATLQQPSQPGGPVDPGYDIDKDKGWLRPTHPILLPPPAAGDGFYVLSYCTSPPPPHWEWILFVPGDAPERPTPVPPEPPSTMPPGMKPPPADGGWGFFPGYGWVYYPGPGGAGPKKR